MLYIETSRTTNRVTGTKMQTQPEIGTNLNYSARQTKAILNCRPCKKNLKENMNIK